MFYLISKMEIIKVPTTLIGSKMLDVKLIEWC